MSSNDQDVKIQIPTVPTCCTQITNTQDLEKLIHMYCKILSFEYRGYELSFMKATQGRIDLTGGEIQKLSEEEYNTQEINVHCGYFQKTLKDNNSYCRVCSLGANCNKLIHVEQEVMGNLLGELDNQQLNLWDILKEKSEVLGFSSMVIHQPGHQYFAVLQILFNILVKNKNKMDIKSGAFKENKPTDYIVDKSDKQVIPPIVVKHLETHLKSLKGANPIESNIEQVLEEIIEHNTDVEARMEEINKNWAKERELEYPQIDKQLVLHGIGIIADSRTVDRKSRKSKTSEYQQSKRKEPDKAICTEVVEQSKVNTKTEFKDEILNAEENEDKVKVPATFSTSEIRSARAQKDMNINEYKQEDQEKIKNEIRTKIDNARYYTTDLALEESVDIEVINVSTLASFQSLGCLEAISQREILRFEFIPETEELISFVDGIGVVIFTFADRVFREYFGLRFISTRSQLITTFNSIPLINYWDKYGYVIDKRNILDFQLAYTMHYFPLKQRKILKFEDFSMFKSNSSTNYRSKVISNIEQYTYFYEEYISYTREESWSFSYYKKELGARYLIGRSSRLQISENNGEEYLIRVFRGFEPEFLQTKLEILNKDKLKREKALIACNFNDLDKYLENYYKAKETRTPLGYSICINDDVDFDEYKRLIKNEFSRFLLIAASQHMRNQYLSFRILCIQGDTFVGMTDKNKIEIASGLNLMCTAMFKMDSLIPEKYLNNVMSFNFFRVI